MATGKLKKVKHTSGTETARLAIAKNDATTLQWFYDKAGNLTTEHQQYAGTGMAVWHHQYDPLGNRIASIRPDEVVLIRQSNTPYAATGFR
ncbi:hypothetical protein AGMMS50289_21900 [Betaproteobacteria bacterium]|nr:hypothetical protein AGMMS50289_21900 [Betaproteobacteria bacterium]